MMQRHLSTGPWLIAALLASHRPQPVTPLADRSEDWRGFLGLTQEVVREGNQLFVSPEADLENSHNDSLGG